jgi:hypothetical protein
VIPHPKIIYLACLACSNRRFWCSIAYLIEIESCFSKLVPQKYLVFKGFDLAIPKMVKVVDYLIGISTILNAYCLESTKMVIEA